MRERERQNATMPLMNVLAEKMVLGALLRSESAYWDLADKLRVDHFSAPFHRDIFSAVKDVCEGNKKLNLSIVRSRLPETYDDGKSTSSYLALLLAEVGDSSATDFADDLIDLWARRQVLNIAKDAEKAARDPGVRMSDVLTEIEGR